MTDTGSAVEATCDDCGREFYTHKEPACCPYCGADSVASGHGVVVRPH